MAMTTSPRMFCLSERLTRPRARVEARSGGLGQVSNACSFPPDIVQYKPVEQANEAITNIIRDSGSSYSADLGLLTTKVQAVVE